MARPRVPQFGKWEGDGNNIPYTVVFEKAREGRGGKMINPNDPKQNPEAFGGLAPPAKPQTRQPEPVRRVPSPGNGARKGDGVGDHNRRQSRTSIGSEHSIDRSPLHHSQPKVTGRGAGSSKPHGTPGRSRPQNLDDNRDRGATLPKFGGWDLNDPNEGAGMTVRFDKVREEKNTGTPNITMEPQVYHNPGQKITANKKAKSSCFPW